MSKLWKLFREKTAVRAIGMSYEEALGFEVFIER